MSVELMHELRRSLRRTRALDLRRFEALPVAELRDAVVPNVLRHLDGLSELLKRIAAHAEAQSEDALREAADHAFMARLELGAQRERLEALGELDEPWLLLGECGRAQCTVLRAGVGVEGALRVGLGIRRSPRRSAELMRSLRLRAAFARLRRELSALDEPSEEEIPAKLSEVASRLESFLLTSDYGDARIDDRLQLRGLQERVRVWLAAEPDVREGLRLWQDLTSCAALLAQINLRTELVEHDRLIVRAAERRLCGKRPPTWVPAPLWARLQRLYGRDDTVDGLLDSGAGNLAVEWHEPIARLKQVLGMEPPPASETSDATGEAAW